MFIQIKDSVKNSINNFSRFEKCLWSCSVFFIVISSILSGTQSVLSFIASLIGATALIFLAKGDVLGQLFSVIFSILYAIVSWEFRYYGEMITYIGMTGPIAAASVISWIKNPYSDREVKVRHTTKKDMILLFGTAIIVTWIFYFILKYFKTANLFWSTISITTSFMAASLSWLRSKFYALWYGLNDIILIILWVLASMENIKFIPMVICFIVFLINDLYGFIQWGKMQERQRKSMDIEFK